MNFDLIAMICHNVNALWCAANNDFSQTTWAEAEEWQQDAARSGVAFLVANPDADVNALHDDWMAKKFIDGWVYGPVKDATAKTHPCLVPFEELPLQQQFKDALFRTIVLTSIGRH